MYNLLTKKQNFKSINKVLTKFENLLINKTKKFNITKDATITFPVFFKGIQEFTLNGTTLRQKRKLSHINQTLTIQSKLSKQLINVTVNTQCPIVKVR